MSGYSAARAEVNGAPIRVTTPKMQIIRNNGILGMAMMATSTARLRSLAIITCLRGSRSARPDRVRPPTKAGTMLTAKVIAASSAEPVRSNTSKVSATLASWSPATDSTWAVHSARNSETPKTWRKVDGLSSVTTSPGGVCS